MGSMPKPAPFQRPVSHAGSHGRSWTSIEAKDLQVDDIVAAFGLLTGVVVRGELVLLTNTMGDEREVQLADRLLAFVES